jgi:dolichol-phosphate mannosyltransferase
LTASTDVLVLVPTYNERENLALLVPRVLRFPGYRLLVIDDASPDGTGELAAALGDRHGGRVQVLHRRRKEGLGRAYVDGMQLALEQHPDLICQMDADGSHDADDLPRLVAAARDSDLVIGSRYVTGSRFVNWPRHRLVLSRMANAYVRIAMGIAVRDCTAGMRCWKPATLGRLALSTLQSNGYAFQVETLHRTLRLGVRVSEVPITFAARNRGTSKLTARILFEAANLPWRLRASRWPPASASGSDAQPVGDEELRDRYRVSRR